MLSFYEKNIIMFNKQSPIYIYIHIYYTRIYIRNFITNKDFVTYHKLKDFFFFERRTKQNKQNILCCCCEIPTLCPAELQEANER